MPFNSRFYIEMFKWTVCILMARKLDISGFSCQRSINKQILDQNRAVTPWFLKDFENV